MKSHNAAPVILAGAGILLAGSLGLKALQGSGPDFVGESDPATIRAGERILDDTNLHTKPFLGSEKDGTDTFCAQLPNGITLPELEVVENGVRDMANGPFYGIDPAKIPNFPEDIRDKCKNSTGLIWVATSQVRVPNAAQTR